MRTIPFADSYARPEFLVDLHEYVHGFSDRRMQRRKIVAWIIEGVSCVEPIGENNEVLFFVGDAAPNQKTIDGCSFVRDAPKDLLRRGAAALIHE
jgi:hypothetical protein